jgi:hypothetical protein
MTITSGLAVWFLLAQLTAPGNNLPQIMTANFKNSAPVKAGTRSDVTVSFNVIRGYVINHTPPISLQLSPVSGVKLEKTAFSTPSPDPNSKDEYYVSLPTLRIPVVAAKAGKYEIPGKLTYFFCSKADGFCSRQVFDIKIPLQVQ